MRGRGRAELCRASPNVSRAGKHSKKGKGKNRENDKKVVDPHDIHDAPTVSTDEMKKEAILTMVQLLMIQPT